MCVKLNILTLKGKIMDNLNYIIAKNLTELRKKNKLTQLEVAKSLNYSDKAISKWEKGESMPSIDVIYKLSKLYNVSIDYLVGESIKTNRPPTPITKKRRISITLLAIVAVWLICLIFYTCFDITANINLWLLFCWAVPASLIIAIIFDCVWNRHRMLYFFVSLLVWSVLVCLYIQFLSYNIWKLFIIGIPLQIAVILWSKIMR